MIRPRETSKKEKNERNTLPSPKRWEFLVAMKQKTEGLLNKEQLTNLKIKTKKGLRN